MQTVMHKETLNPNRWLYWLVWLTLFLLASIPVAWSDDYRYDRDRNSYSYDRDRDRGDYQSSDRARSRRFSENRQAVSDFMDRLMDYEASAIELARAGMNKTRHRELANFLDGVDQWGVKRVNRLANVVSDAYGVRLDARTTPKYEKRADVLRDPNVRGDEFEIRLLKSIIEEHQQEAAFIQRNLPNIDNDQVRRTVQDLYDLRVKNARQCQSWLKSWYDIDYGSKYESAITGERRDPSYYH